MIWTTKIIDLIKENQIPSTFLTISPFWKGQENIRKEGLTFELTEDEKKEIEIVNKDIITLTKYFNIKLHDHQHKLLQSYQEYRFNWVQHSRQMGITTCNAILCLHFVLINKDDNIIFFTNKLLQGSEFINKVKEFYQMLPFYLKPGITAWNQHSIHFENGVKIKVITPNTSNISNIGYNIDCAIIQDIQQDYLETIMRSYYPMIAAHQYTKMIVTGNIPNSNKSIFKETKLKWNLISGRDEKWKIQTIKDIGSLEAFNKEYELVETKNEESTNSWIDEIISVAQELKKDANNLTLAKKLKKLCKTHL